MILGITGQQRANNQLQVHRSVLHLETQCAVCVKVRFDTDCCRTAGLNFSGKKCVFKHLYAKGQQYKGGACQKKEVKWETQGRL